MKRRDLIRLLAAAPLLFPAAAGAEDAAGFPVLRWEPVFEGVSRTEFRLTSPRPVRAVALKIELQGSGVTFLATPDNGPEEGETAGSRTSTFLRTHNLQAAINAAPFSPVAAKEGVPQDVVGLHISEGKVVSPPGPKHYPALVITRDNRARILDRCDAVPKDAWNAVGGFQVILRNGAVVQGGPDLHPRTAAGITRDGRTMIWLVIDGRQRGYSEGATTAEAGTWLKAMGCHSGINLDGGGTSTLVIAGPDGPQILNRPIHAGVPGRERVAGSHLGLRAKPLAGPGATGSGP